MLKVELYVLMVNAKLLTLDEIKKLICYLKICSYRNLV